MVTDAERACFEAGVKFGSLYHQFAGAPVGPESVESLAAAIEESIENQPYCESVTVEPQMDVLADAIAAGSADYVEFTGRFVEVEIVVVHEGVEVVAEMAMDDGYPLMEPVSVSDRG
ncbi:MAG: dihydroneopterin aldolase family protein [Halobacteriaceae archaeon]